MAVVQLEPLTAEQVPHAIFVVSEAFMVHTPKRQHALIRAAYLIHAQSSSCICVDSPESAVASTRSDQRHCQHVAEPIDRLE